MTIVEALIELSPAVGASRERAPPPPPSAAQSLCVTQKTRAASGNPTKYAEQGAGRPGERARIPARDPIERARKRARQAGGDRSRSRATSTHCTLVTTAAIIGFALCEGVLAAVPVGRIRAGSNRRQQNSSVPVRALSPGSAYARLIEKERTRDAGRPVRSAGAPMRREGFRSTTTVRGAEAGPVKATDWTGCPGRRTQSWPARRGPRRAAVPSARPRCRPVRSRLSVRPCAATIA